MHYKVTATLRVATAAELHRRLTDGSIKAQQPDGQEIVDSMQRAVVTEDGHVQWSEVCYCDTPLYHERTTVYDQHFDELETVVIGSYESYQGRPFMDYLGKLVADG